MNAIEAEDEPRRGAVIVDAAFTVYLRVLSLICLALTLMVWGWAVGFFEGAGNRFDEMQPAIRTHVAMLAVLLPIASVGLWTTLPWGRVVWLIAVMVQLALLYGVGAELDYRGTAIIAHLTMVGLFVILLWLQLRIASKA